MLVLTRKVGQRIEVGDGEVVVRVLKVAGTKVVLGVEAPGRDIWRGEIADEISAEAER